MLIVLFLITAGFSPAGEQDDLCSRLGSIENEVPLTCNNHVRKYIEVYAVKKSQQTRRMLVLGSHYFPMIESILAEKGLPEELKYMAVIESALNPTAVSRVGATGMWQFMYSTAREYRLSINGYVDQRKEPETSTRAAAEYLSRMYARYGDWLMVIASYNCGPGNVNKAIRRSGGKRDFWSIYRYLPRETRGYVPAFIAAACVMEHAADYGLTPDPAGSEYLSFQPVSTSNELLLQDIAVELSIDAADLEIANASLCGQIVPAGYALRLPGEKHGRFHEMEDRLYAMAEQRIEQFRPRRRSSGRSIRRVVPDDPDLTPIIYTVKAGDNLGFVASWYNVGLSSLKAWNGKGRNRIVVGEELIVYVHKDLAPTFSRYDLLSNRQKNILSSDRRERMLYAKRHDDRYLYHEVSKGETFWTIVQQYPGTTLEGVRKLNQIGDRELRPGMYLRIMKNS